MPDVSSEAIDVFETEYQQQHKAQKREYRSAYLKFIEKNKTTHATKEAWSKVDRQKWIEKLTNHFQYEPKGGATYLVLLAKQHWQQWGEKSAAQRTNSIFDTPLFQPRWHERDIYSIFEKSHNLSGWNQQLKKQLPDIWLRGLDESKLILPVPLVEIGPNISGELKKQIALSRKANDKQWKNELGNLSGDLVSNNIAQKSGLLLNLMTDYYFYLSSARTNVLNIGRIFELVITSIITDIELSDLRRIINSAPFYSAKSQAPDVAISGQDESNDEDEQEEMQPDENFDPIDSALQMLQQEIAEWRKEFQINSLDLSPWLVYQVFGKVYESVADNQTYNRGLSGLNIALNKAGLVFYSIWSGFGSFEKGQIFGLPALITDKRLLSAKNFESNDHFKINVGHLAPHSRHFGSSEEKNYSGEEKIDSALSRREFGLKTRTITNALANHPLRKWMDDINNFMIGTPFKKPIIIGKELSAKEWLCTKLNIFPIPNVLTHRKIAGSLGDMEYSKCQDLLDEMISIFKGKNDTIPLTKAIEYKFGSKI